MTNTMSNEPELCDYMEWNTHLEETNELLQKRVRQLDIDLKNMTTRRRAGLYDYINMVIEMYYDRYGEDEGLAYCCDCAFHRLEDAYNKTYWDMDKVEYNNAIKEVLYDDWHLQLTTDYDDFYTPADAKVIDTDEEYIVVETDLIKHYKAFEEWDEDKKFVVMDDMKCKKFPTFDYAVEYMEQQPIRTATQLFSTGYGRPDVEDGEYFIASVATMEDWNFIRNDWEDKVDVVEKSVKIIEDFISKQIHNTHYKIGRKCFDARLRADDLY